MVLPIQVSLKNHLQNRRIDHEIGGLVRVQFAWGPLWSRGPFRTHPYLSDLHWSSGKLPMSFWCLSRIHCIVSSFQVFSCPPLCELPPFSLLFFPFLVLVMANLKNNKKRTVHTNKQTNVTAGPENQSDWTMTRLQADCEWTMFSPNTGLQLHIITQLAEKHVCQIQQTIYWYERVYVCEGPHSFDHISHRIFAKTTQLWPRTQTHWYGPPQKF